MRAAGRRPGEGAALAGTDQRSDAATRLRRARVGVTLLFFVNAVAFMSIVPRFAQIKQALELSDGAWGVTLAIGPVGGLVAGLATARLMRRWNSATVAVVAQAGSLALINVLVNAPVAVVFAAGLFLVLALDAICDIAMNSHGLRVQREYGRSILNSFHAWWSVGAVSGGLIGSVFLQLGVALWLQGLVTSVIFMALALYARSLLLPGTDPGTESQSIPAKTSRVLPVRVLLRLIALGALGASAALIEDSGASWSAVYMERSFEVLPFMVGMGFVALQGAQTIGRFVGDWIVDRIGHQAAVVQGGLIAMVGMGVAITFPSPASTILGFACAGWGMATVIPAAMHAADNVPGLPAGTGLTIATWLMRVGFLAGPPLIGALAEITALRWALLVIPAVALLIVVLSPVLRPVAPSRNRTHLG